MQDLPNAVHQRKNAELLLQTQVSFAFVTVYALTLMTAVMIFHKVTAHQNRMVN